MIPSLNKFSIHVCRPSTKSCITPITSPSFLYTIGMTCGQTVHKSSVVKNIGDCYRNRRLNSTLHHADKYRNEDNAQQNQTKPSHQLFYPQLGVKLCSMAGGGVQKIYMVFLREPSRRDRSGSDLFHLRDGFEIKMNFDRNVSCFIFVNALMHDDFFD